MTRFRDRYRVESTRLPGWNYARAGWCFELLCTKDRVCFCGEVVGGQVHLSPSEAALQRIRRTLANSLAQWPQDRHDPARR
jgi:hypothetical protein